ncbi:MAG: hypothetical protein KJ060_15465 [Candidatus Hydrogenedentes bacterium]|nr:hypothetical protein [Candidatus Hydrogenedentota bacterium]
MSYPDPPLSHDASSTDTSPPPLSPAPPVKPLLVPALTALVGVIVISVMALLETQIDEDQVWRNALLAASGEPLHDDALILHTRKISDENFPPSPLAEQLHDIDGGAEVIALLGLEMRERIIAMELSPEQWQALTASGSPPEPGKRQVLAGPLCRLEEFTVDGETFTVTGKLQRGTAGMAFSYLLPYDDAVAPLFTEEAGATTGWLEPEGQTREPTEEEIAALESEAQQIIAPMVPTTMPLAWGGFLGILLVTIGGAVFQVRVLFRLIRIPLLEPIIAPMRQYWTLFVAVHLLCYGALFAATLAAFAMPLLNLQVLTFVTEIFTTGELSHLGDAYMSGNVISAAWFTFKNNFVVQTLIYSIAPSLIVPFLGLFKTMLNLAVAGFALAPLWTDLLSRFTYHSVTLSLEVEAYVVAAFGICLYPIYIARALTSGEPAKGLLKVPPMLIASIVVSGALLFLGAVYEAVTLILIG